jgi:two-component system chemotaxis sensor kinase CheA
MDINARVFAAFQSENKEQLEAIRSIMSSAPKPGDPLFNEALRLAHTMKAGARVCGLEGIQDLAHRMETLFAHVRDSTLPLSGEVTAVVSGSLDAIEDAMASAAAGQPPMDLKPALATIDRLLHAPAAVPPRGRPSPESTRRRVLAAFQSEQVEHIAGIRALVAKHGNTVPSEADLNEIVRLAHTLKGGARISGLPVVETLSHHLESIFVQIKNGALHLGPPAAEVIAQTLNAIEDWMAALAASQTPADPAPAFQALANLLGAQTAAPPVASRQSNPEPQSGPGPPPPRAESPATPSTGLQPCDRQGYAPRPEGPPAPLGRETPEPQPAPSRQLQAAPGVAAPVSPVPQSDMLRLSAEHLDRLLRSSGQLVTESLRQDRVSRGLADLSRDIDEIDREWENLREVSAAHLHRLSATPEFSRLLHYLDFVERQVRIISRQARQVRALQAHSSRSVRVLGRELQENVRKARMIPAESLFGVFRKMVRDMARDENKTVDFHVTGLDVQADRMVLQALKDPVMHMLRNAISHGIEPEPERKRAGKPGAGCVSLKIEASGNRLTLLVDDDGRGLDLPRVTEVAIRKGLLNHAGASTLSPEELAAFIFQPGFSTARAVTDLSGRGMGLSVVYEAVSRLQGEVRAIQKPGPGACVILSVPLSISTHRLLLVSSRGQTFAIPSSGVERLIRATLADVDTVEGKPLILFEKQPIPLASLAQLLGLDESIFAVEGDTLPTMILKSGARRLAVAVDAFLAEREAIIKNLDAPLAGIGILAGGIVLEDGAVALVLNTGELIETFKPVHAPPVARPGEIKPQEKSPTVLIVDDSFTARTLEKSILEVHGYNVLVAIDGTEALSKLRSEEIDLVISDVQMPRMDGLALLREMKRDERFSQLPVILVTSMDRAEDQERGLSLGADAYLVKQRFDHQTLLDTIRQLL